MRPAAHFASRPVKETITTGPAEVTAVPAAYEKIGARRTCEVEIVLPQLFNRESVSAPVH